MTSGTPPARVEMGTTSHAMASSAARPNDSSSLGSSMMSAMRQLLLDLILLAEKQDVLVNALLHGQPLGDGAVGTIADQQQL